MTVNSPVICTERGVDGSHRRSSEIRSRHQSVVAGDVAVAARQLSSGCVASFRLLVVVVRDLATDLLRHSLRRLVNFHSQSPRRRRSLSLLEPARGLTTFQSAGSALAAVRPSPDKSTTAATQLQLHAARVDVDSLVY